MLSFEFPVFLHGIGPMHFLSPHRHTRGWSLFFSLQVALVSTPGAEGRSGRAGEGKRGRWERTGQWGVRGAPGDPGVSLLTVAGLWPQLTFLHASPLLLLLDSGFFVGLCAGFVSVPPAAGHTGPTQESGPPMPAGPGRVSPWGVSQP